MKAKKRPLASIAGDIRAATGRETADIIKIGALLTEVKDSRHLPHGTFLPWLKSEFSMSERSSQRYMLAHKFAVKYDIVSDLNLSPTALFLLSGRRNNDDDWFTPEVLETIFAEAKLKRVGKDRCWEIALPPDPAERAEEEAEQEAGRDAKEAEGILDGPPPDLPPPSPEPSPPPPKTMPPDPLQLEFQDHIAELKQLTTKPMARFTGAVADGDLETVGDFLNAVAKRATANDGNATQLQNEKHRLWTENLGLRSEIEELKAEVSRLSFENAALKMRVEELEKQLTPATAAASVH